VTPTGTPGEYRTSVALASGIPMGYYKLYCVHCTLADGSANFAPNSDISSDETAIVSDNSAFVIGPSLQPLLPQQRPADSSPHPFSWDLEYCS
jgi:hypothetical protein